MRVRLMAAVHSDQTIIDEQPTEPGAESVIDGHVESTHETHAAHRFDGSGSVRPQLCLPDLRDLFPGQLTNMHKSIGFARHVSNNYNSVQWETYAW